MAYECKINFELTKELKEKELVVKCINDVKKEI